MPDVVFDEAKTNSSMELWRLYLRDSKLRSRLAAICERLIFPSAATIWEPDESPLAQERAFAAVQSGLDVGFLRHLSLVSKTAEGLRNMARQVLTDALIISTPAGG